MYHHALPHSLNPVQETLRRRPAADYPSGERDHRMHREPFDRLTRALGGRLGRRQAGGMLAASGLAALLEGSGTEAKKKKKCKGGLTTCKIKKGKKKKRICVNAQSDPANCGACGHACSSGQTCTNGTCTTAACISDPATVTCAGKCGPTANNCGTTVQCDCSTYVYDRTITTSAVNRNGVLIFPDAVVQDSAGAIYVLDQFTNRIQVFDAEGNFLRQWGGPGQLSSPGGIAIDTSDTVYAIETINRRIQKFATDGTSLGFIGSWTASLGDATGIALDSAGNLYVSFQTGIRKLNSSGGFVASWTNGGTFSDLAGIAFDSQDRGYVADAGGNRVFRFTLNLALIDQFGTSGTGNGEFDGPYGIAIDSTDTIFVSDANNSRVQRFVLDGANVDYDGQWGTAGPDAGEFLQPRGVLVSSDGAIFVADRGNHRIQKFGSNLAFAASWGVPSLGMMLRPYRITVDGAGNAYVIDDDLQRVTRFASNGTPDLMWGSFGSGPGMFTLPRSIAAGASTVYVGDSTNMVQAFNTAGAYQDMWGGSGSGNGEFDFPTGIAVDAAGQVFVADGNNRRIQVFTSTGGYVTTWGDPGTGPGQFSSPNDVAIDGSGNVYVVDFQQQRIKKFSNAGVYQTEWPAIGARALTVEKDTGEVFVINWSTDQVDRYSSTGSPLGSFGASGTGEGKLNDPMGIAIAADGTVYIADTGNRNVQVYVPASSRASTHSAKKPDRNDDRKRRKSDQRKLRGDRPRSRRAPGRGRR